MDTSLEFCPHCGMSHEFEVLSRWNSGLFDLTIAGLMVISTFGLSLLTIKPWRKCKRCGGLSRDRKRDINRSSKLEVQKRDGCKCKYCNAYPFDPFSDEARKLR